MELQAYYLDEILVFVIFAVSLNLLLGYTGQVSVAQAAFGAIGGYSVAYLWLHYHTPFLLSVVIGVGIGGVVGIIIGLPALRLSTEWLILLTLAVQTIIVGILTSSNSFGGTYGLQGISGLTLFGLRLDVPTQDLPIFSVCALIVLALCWRMGQSAFGRVLRGIREDSLVVRSLGKNVTVYKLIVFAVTSAMAALAGSLLAVLLTNASPTSFDFDQSTVIIAMVILGGTGSLRGSIVGAVVIILTKPFFEDVIKLSPVYASLWRLLAYGLLVVLVMRVRPQGIIPEGFRIRHFWVRRVPRLGGAEATPAIAGEGLLPGDLSRIVARTSESGMDNGASAISVLEGSGSEVTLSALAVPTTRCDALEERNGEETVLEVRGLSKRFGGIVAADDVNLDLRRGTITALVGPNGAGKTTIFNLLTGAIKPDHGRIVLRGRDVSGMRPDAVARVGMVRSFQDVRVMPRLTCRENVMLAAQNNCGEHLGPLFFRPMASQNAEKAVRGAALRWLEFVGMSKQADVLAGTLGFGEQKLVALARVLASEAEVLLLDEPASGIDQQWVDVMLSLIEELPRQGRTVCIVEHNLSVVSRLANTVYFMELGRIAAEGTFATLTGDAHLAEAYFGTV